MRSELSGAAGRRESRYRGIDRELVGRLWREIENITVMMMLQKVPTVLSRRELILSMCPGLANVLTQEW